MQHHTVSTAAAGFLCLVAGQCLDAQREPAWVEQASYGTPPEGRWGHAMAYSPAAGMTVMFGGRNAAGLITMPGHWYWRGFDPANPVPPRSGSWGVVAGITAPSPREGHAMVYDAFIGRILVVGGRSATAYLDDMWYLTSGNQWQQMSLSPRPMARSHAAMAYDSRRGRVVLFGGFNGTDALADTWEFTGLTPAWSLRFPATFPAPRYGVGMAFDSRRNRMVAYGGNLSGGTTMGDTWEYDGATWSRAFPATTPGLRYTPTMAFDEQRGVTVLSGGFYRGNETWEYDGVDWRQRATGLPLPYSRGEAAMVFDSGRNRMVMFGGNEQGAGLNDTWEYHYPYGYETWGSGCAGSAGVPILWTNVTSPGLLGYDLSIVVGQLHSGMPTLLVSGLSTSTWSGGPLPADLASMGMPGCTLYVSIDAVALAVAPATTASFALSLPVNPMFLGYQLHNQALVLDPLAGNPAAAVVSNAGTVTIGN